ncbi:foldase protein prsA [Streptococcus pneumoniae 2070108]|nr:foldase protein prsA [Streptococcus pneumoniae GA16833]EJG36903.1 foldase protein prsA [Streptococcus pneumoniae 2090008]EJG40998.1 foldase protein prsA [Streptococcus pneumoniae 2070108]
MTLETRKAQIRTSKLVELAVKKVAEAELTDEAYKKAFDEYTPDVTAQIIRLNNEDKAKEVLEKAKAEGADFAQLAKDNSTDEKTKKMVEKLPLILLQQKYLSKSKKPLSL